MTIRPFALLLLITIAPTLTATTARDHKSPLHPVRLRVEYATNPIGLDVAVPRLYWQLDAAARDQRQSAWRVIAASRPELLRSGRGDKWDSGRVASSENIHIPWAGSRLRSRERVWWKVQVWDQQGRQSDWSDAAFFEMGLLAPADWRAGWITIPPRGDDERLPLRKAKWIYDSTDVARAQGQKLQLWREVVIPPERRVTRAEMHYAADVRERERGTQLFINGTLDPSIWRSQRGLRNPSIFTLRDYLRPGSNTLAVETMYSPGRGFIALIEIELDDGQVIEIPTDSRWMARVTAKRERWSEADRSETGWGAAREVGRFGDIIAGYETYRKIDKLVPPPYLRREFDIRKPVRNARIYSTATGVYELSLNGERVGADLLAPGWTDYGRRIQYQTYDVTSLLRRGANVLGGIVGDGWYSGHNGLFNVNPNYYGYEKALLCQLHIDYADGSSETILSDGNWRGTTGAIRYSDMFMGETYDARRELQGWDRPGYDASNWRTVSEVNPPVGRLVAQVDPPVRRHMELRARTLRQVRPGVYIYDLGQNMVGWVRLRVKGRSGQRVKIRYGELLNQDGTLFVENLRQAISTDYYYCRGGGQESWEPRFTFHGFRYVELSGLDAAPAQDDINGVVISSDLPASGSFETSNPLLNQLQSNIVWGQRGNFISVPTDCPQRDERDGWTGDIQAFSRTASFNMETAAFLGKWLIDLEDGQDADGSLPDIAPASTSFGRGKFGWGDAGVIVPMNLWHFYADKRMLTERYGMMKRWVEYLRRNARDAQGNVGKGYLAPTDSYGDWVSPKPEAPKPVLSTIFFARVTWLLARAAEITGQTSDATEYQHLFEQIRKAFNEAHVTADGRIESDTQSVYVLALHFDLLPQEKRAPAARHLAAAIERAEWHPGTGFLGAAHLLPALTDAGYTDIAYRLLLQETSPGWLSTVRNGATTIWERWDGYDPKQGPSNMGNMNSFNHYAFGAVGEWMYANIAGLDSDPQQPGFRHIIIRPRPGGGLTSARGEYDSLHGSVLSDWKISDSGLNLKVKIPANTTATIYVPATSIDQVSESGKPAIRAEGLRFVEMKEGYAVFAAGSGEYNFSVRRN